MKKMNGIEKKRDVMFGMSSTQDHSERFGGKEGHKIREREKKRTDPQILVIVIGEIWKWSSF